MDTDRIKKRISKSLEEALNSGVYKNKKELSDKLKTNPTSLNKYLAGETFPQVDGIFHLCKELNINPNWIIFGEDEPKITVDTEINHNTVELAQQLAITQKIVIEYKDKEIVELKKEIAALKKSLTAKDNIKHTVKESITQLSDDVK